MKSVKDALAVCLITTFGCVLSWPVSAQSISIATYNLNWGNRQPDHFLDAIAESKADIVCFQESTPGNERILRDKLSATHPFFQAVGHNGKYLAERFAIVSKYELKDTQFTPPGGGLFGFYSTRFSIAGKSVHLVNVHLTPFQVSRQQSLTNVWSTLRATEDVHLSEINVVLDAIKLDQPTIIVGDFNSISTFQAPQRLVSSGMIDAYAERHPDADDDPTWTWPTRPLPLSLRIDYVFHTKHFTTREAKVIARKGSDHYLVVATLSLD